MIGAVWCGSESEIEELPVSTFESAITEVVDVGLHSAGIDTIQVNVGFICNQTCRHCHVGASPFRTESMTWSTMEQVLAAARGPGGVRIDITGGAPELNPNITRFIEALTAESFPVQVRTNLTVLLEKGQEEMPAFYREHGVQLVGSLPCYMEENVAAQRGPGTYERSIEAIRRLNRLGYGQEEELQLNLVYNPTGPFLPPDQAELEEQYRRELLTRFGITFSNLLTITNMPIGRFEAELKKNDKDQAYLELLKNNFNPETVDGLMCRHQVSVGWDGTLYDCDFNLVLDMLLDSGAPNHISRFDSARIAHRKIRTGEHCFGCTAGAGSSCGGALS